MVRLTRAVVLQGISKVSIDKRDTLEIDKEFGRITHLHLQRKKISTLDSLHLFHSLTVLYLYENQISRIEGLQQAYNLEILHLQRNRIQRIENLLECRQLRILYLGYNEIDTVEGLHSLERLEELHVENQRLPVGTSLTFDPKSLATLSNTLILLNVTGNHITHLEDLAGMEELHTLMAGDNYIQDLDSAALVIRTMANLQVLDLRNNPIAKRPQFKERIIGYGVNIKILNEKEVTDTMRDFIQRFAAVKANRLQSAVHAYQRSQSELIERPSTKASVGPDASLVTQSDNNIPDSLIPGKVPSTASQRDLQSALRRRDSLTSPSKSNLLLNLSSSDVDSNSRCSFTQTNTYVRNPAPRLPTTSMPQFILAPPKFNQPYSAESLPGKTIGGKKKKRGSIAVPKFNKSKRDSMDSTQSENSLFKTPAGNPFQNERGGAVVKLIKPPMNLRCSRESFLEGMPMPSKSLLRLDSSGGQEPGDVLVTPKVRSSARFFNSKDPHKPSSAVEVSEEGHPHMVPNELLDKPPFTTSVYELPPWPHIVRRWAAEQPAVTFMP